MNLNEQIKSQHEQKIPLIDQKKLTILPKSIIRNGIQKADKVFNLYQLQHCWLNCNSLFKNLCFQLTQFNRQLQQTKQKSEFPIVNYLKTYHLYKNLYEQLHNVGQYSLNLSDANKKLQQISVYFLKQKQKIRQIKPRKQIFPEIKYEKLQNQQDLRKTMYQIKKKREYEVFNIMSTSSYSQHFPSKQQRIIKYQKQQSLNDIFQQQSAKSQFVSEPYSLITTPKNNQQKLAVNMSLLDKSKLVSTAYNSQYQNSTLKTSKYSKNSLQLKTIKSQIKLKEAKNRSISTIPTPSSSNKKLFQKNQSHPGFQFKNLSLSSKTKNNKKYQNPQIMDQLITKDNVQITINEPDNCKQKLLSKVQEKHNLQVQSYKVSRISFIMDQKKHQITNRQDFVKIESQLNKFKFKNSRFKSQLNRKLQFRKYLSNHQKLNKIQISRNQKFNSLSNLVGKNIIQLTKNKQNELASLNNQNLSQRKLLQSNQKRIVIPLQKDQSLNPIQHKRRQFQQSLRKQSFQKTIQTYSKYINRHIIQESGKNDDEQRLNQSKTSSFYKTNSSNFSSKRLSDFQNTRKSLFQKSQARINSLTNFKFDSIKPKPIKNVSLSKLLEQNSAQKYNKQAANNLLKLKLKLSQNYTSNNPSQNRIITNKTLYKGLSVHQVDQNLKYQPIPSKLFNNPFFVAPKSKKGKNKKSKK